MKTLIKFIATVLLIAAASAQAGEQCNSYLTACESDGKNCRDLYYEVGDYIHEIDANTTVVYDSKKAFLLNTGFDNVMYGWEVTNSCNSPASFTGHEMPIGVYKGWVENQCSTNTWKWVGGLIGVGLVVADCILTLCAGTTAVSTFIGAGIAGAPVAVGAVAGVAGVGVGVGADALSKKVCAKDSRVVKIEKAK